MEAYAFTSNNKPNPFSSDFQQQSANFLFSGVTEDFNLSSLQTAINAANNNAIQYSNLNGFDPNQSQKSSDYSPNTDINVQTRIKHLEEELANTQADKEFVWSLWRQLQTANPDVTNCIASVVKREKDKAELKDRKVLDILQAKDDKINELYEAFQMKEKEIGEIGERLKKSEDSVKSKAEELRFMEMNAKTFSDKELMYEQMLRGRDDKLDSLTRESEAEKQHLVAKLRDLVGKTAEAQEKEAILQRENTKQNQMIEMLNTEMKNSNENYEKLMLQLNSFRQQVDEGAKLEAERLSRECQVKQEQNEKLRKELNELWTKFNTNADHSAQQEALIRQLKQTQMDLQESARLQKESLEKENSSYRSMYEQMSTRYEEALRDQKKAADERRKTESGSSEKVASLEYEIEQLRIKTELQSQQICDKKMVCDGLTRKIEELEEEISRNQSSSDGKDSYVPKFKPRSSILKNSGSTSMSSSSDNFQKADSSKKEHQYRLEEEVEVLSSQKNMPRVDLHRSKSFSRSEYTKNDEYRCEMKRSKSFDRWNEGGFNTANPYFKGLNSSSQDLTKEAYLNKELNKLKQYYENLCRAKDKQLETMRLAHQRRLERLLSLEKQYKLLKNHLKSYVDEEGMKENYKKSNRSSSHTATLNDTQNCINKNSQSNIYSDPPAYGYLRSDSDLLRNELKASHHENRRLFHENLDMKERLDILKVKCDEQNEHIHSLELELNYKLKQREHSSVRASKQYEMELRTCDDRLRQSVEEVFAIRKRLDEADTRCKKLTTERNKFLELTEKLTEENKKLYKKWFQVRTNESKFRSSLIEQINRRSGLGKGKKKLGRLEKQVVNSGEFLMELVSESDASLSSSVISVNEEMSDNRLKKSKKNFMSFTDTHLRSLTSRLKRFKRTKKDQTLDLVHKQFTKLTEQKLELEAKLVQSKAENDKLEKDSGNLELKIRHLKSQIDAGLVELKSLRKREQEFKEREAEWQKHEGQLKDEVKKPLELKIRQLNGDLSRQVNTAKTLKVENEKLSDRLAVNVEKLNHTERDNGQKKQLIEFYKKKLDEISSTEKSEAASCRSVDEVAFETINELKGQVKKLNETIEKLKVEIKSLKNRIQVVQTEKTTCEARALASDKKLEEVTSRVETLKKEKASRAEQLKQTKQKVIDLETYVEKLESTAESKIQTLSDATHQTLSIAQFRLKFAFKSVDNYEKMFKYLYESLVDRCVELRRELSKEKKLKVEMNEKEKIRNECDQFMNDNMKMAMNLASNVLNLTSNEIEDILSSSVADNNDLNRTSVAKQEVKGGDSDAEYKKNCAKQLCDFELRLNSTKKEKQIKSLTDLSKELESIGSEDINKEICEMISQRFNEVLGYEKELASLNALKIN